MVSIRLHYDSGKKACWPFAISQKIGVGRCLVACRDISPGELILYDASVTSGPRQGKVHIYKSPEQLFIMIYLGRGRNFLLLLGSYYTYWSYYTYCLIFFLIESIISMYWTISIKIHCTVFFTTILHTLSIIRTILYLQVYILVDLKNMS